ncbi:FMN reductase (NADPH) [Oceanobacillus limi]|uniref:FMN reductase (NADPH) n=1 Tax=Oceanobacillus limi TaxID=930131 RepID=A0A1I0D9I1_9BACI|nr:oxygen-insensitive NADPH nitroreductase [Oceanobacillus limi]SET28309.1 FMN reductase (NADPH) [Oceanobacillus limi]
MNQIIETIFNHRSIRKFTEQKLTQEQIKTIVSAAQQASTSSYVMAYSIIGITDESLKGHLANISGQPYVKDNGHLMVFCADLHRVSQLATIEVKEKITESVETTEQFMVSIIDSALAAQNASIVAESMGLGICYIGSLRNNIKRVNDLLELPNHVIPLFGLAIGYPAEHPERKPRLPFNMVYHKNKYQPVNKKQFKEFDETLDHYYQNRSDNTRADTWTEQMIRKYSRQERLDVSPFVKDKKLNKR